MSVTDTYKVVYQNDVAAAIANLERYIQAVRTAIKVTEDLEVLMKRLGRDTSFLTGFTNALGVMARAISDAGNRATKTNADTSKIGSDTSKVAALTAQVQQLTAALAAAEAQAKQTKAAAGNIGSGTGGGGGKGLGVGKLAGGVAVASFANALLSASRGAFSGSETTAIESADKAQEFRESRREIASMMGESGVTDKVLDSSLRTMRASGMTAEEEAKFTAEYYGSSETGRKKGNIGQGMNADQRAKLEQEMRDAAARIAVQKGMDPKTAGDLAGVVSQYMPINSAADLAGQISSLYTSAQEGRGAVSPMIQGMLSQAPAAISSGRVSGLPEFGAWIGMGSTFSRSAKSAGVTYSWIDRALGRTGGQAGDYLGRVGAGKQPTLIGKLESVKADLDKVEGDKLDYLSRQGFGSMEDRRSILAYTENIGVLKKNIEDAKVQATKGGDAINASLMSQSDPNVRRRSANAQKEAAEIQRGRKTEGYVAAMVAAEARLIDRGEIDTTSTNLTDATVDKLSITSGRGQRLQSEVTQGLVDRFKAAGGTEKDFFGKYGAIQNPDIGVRSEAYNRVEEDIQKMERETAEKQKQAANNLEDATGKLSLLLDGRPGGQLPGAVPYRA